MTIQVKDGFFYRDRQFAIFAEANSRFLTSPTDFFHPEDFGLKTWGCSTACWRGFIARFTLDEANRLILKDLYVAPLCGNPPLLNGVRPIELSYEKRSNFCGCRFWYRDVALRYDYTGSILIGGESSGWATGWIYDVTAYRVVFELDFENGLLTRAVDRSENAARAEKARKSDEFRKRCENGEFGAAVREVFAETFDAAFVTKWFK